jgi:hypothetical protein
MLSALTEVDTTAAADFACVPDSTNNSKLPAKLAAQPEHMGGILQFS